jgi:hypothetical protein
VPKASGGRSSRMLGKHNKLKLTTPMANKRAFISFDYDHDADLKLLLIGQTKHPDTDFKVVDMSIKEVVAVNWKENARRRIKGCDVMIVICGEYTHTASGVAAEVRIAKEEGVPHFLLWGRSSKHCTKPPGATSADKIYKWTWDNLKALVAGAR